MKIALANLFKRRNRHQIALEVEEELQFHLEMLERKYAQHGLSAAETRAAASTRFGNLEKVKEQCVAIRRRNTLLRRILKTILILVGLTGLAIHLTSTDYKVARIGQILIEIAIAGRLLIYVRGLTPLRLVGAKDSSLSITGKPECS